MECSLSLSSKNKIPSTIYANTVLQLGSLVSGTASQHVTTADSVDSLRID